ncbi:sodium-coupled monocarboxylate transporter 1-like isoform X2 [Clavelina lepadiformis]|uniref:sodium-coupled monocarboxylate transporter 1-like isoform X2 n=1 Tax=Clavelina lepadiformis TaxID=159417 RepID=UPI004042F21A
MFLKFMFAKLITFVSNRFRLKYLTSVSTMKLTLVIYNYVAAGMSYTELSRGEFSTADFVVFVGMLAAAALVGIYYAIKDRRVEDQTLDNYNLGGRSMSAIPLGLSMAVTYISAITIIGAPTEAYNYGMMVLWYSAAPIISNVIGTYCLSLLHSIVRKLCSAISIVQLTIYMGITVYLPALAINALTPLSLNWSIMITSGLCTFYTVLGGMKAVVWTDTLQTTVIFAGGFAALVKTIVIVGGFGKMWDALERGGRMNIFEFNIDLTLQRTFWTIFIGATVMKTRILCCTQPSTQRFLSCKSVTDARFASIICMVLSIIISLVAYITGCAAYAYFENCDPLKYGRITKKDQFVAVLISDVFSDVPGMAGLFVSAAFSGTLSSVSSGINSLGALILEDFVIPRKPQLSNRKKVLISKITGVLLGFLTALVAFSVQTLGGTIVSIISSINGSPYGTCCGFNIYDLDGSQFSNLLKTSE